MTTETLDKQISRDFIEAAADKLAVQISERVRSPINPQEILDECRHLLNSGEPLHHIHGNDEEVRLQKMLILSGLKLALSTLAEQRFSHQTESDTIKRTETQWQHIMGNPEIRNLCGLANEQPDEKTDPAKIAAAIDEVLTKIE